MAVIYRSMEASELPEVLKLWDDVFKNPEWNFKAEIDAVENLKLPQTRVAVEDSGRIVAVVQYFILNTRGADGTPHLMGGIANVATLPDARKQGHSGKLLLQATEEMAKDGCAWSMLFTGVNPHYEHYGWKTVPTEYREGSLIQEPANPSKDWYVESSYQSVSDDILPAIIKIYNEYNAARPLSHVRSLKFWQVSMPPKWGLPGTFIFTARKGGAQGEICAYTTLRINPANAMLFLREAGYLPGCESALESLFNAIRGFAIEKSLSGVNIHLPSEPGINAALSRLVSDIKTGTSNGTMTRPIGTNITQEDIEGLFALPGAHFGLMDHF